MAEAKKATLKTSEAKTEAKLPDTKTVKVVDAKTSEVKIEAAKAEAAKSEAEKKEVAKKPAASKKVAAPKKVVTPKKTVVKAETKKATVTEIVNFEFSDKSYTQDDLIKIAKDVFKYDLKMKAADLKSINLYVKPEESLVYYVINGDITGSFLI
ncbi:MAG: DUF6465 family protein [Lachnospiraceae bacterium]|jgi:hypothetical protein|nr:DUF6465 family protein [Lachnospiraceae bacterium]